MKTNPRTPIRQALTLSLLLLALCLTMPSCSKHDEMPDEDEAPGGLYPGRPFTVEAACVIYDGYNWVDGKLAMDLLCVEYPDSVSTELQLVKANPPIDPYLFVVPPRLRLNGQTYSIGSISNSAFENDRNLQGIEIPKTVKRIGTYAFRGCQNLKQVTIHGNPFIEFEAFPDGFEPTFVE